MTDVALALIRRDGRWFLQRRDPANPVLPGLWEFPGGKVEPGEPLLAGLRRELEEEIGLRLDEARPLVAFAGGQDGRARISPFLVTAEGVPCTALGWGWFSAGELLRLPTPPDNGPLLRALAKGGEPAGT